MKNRTRIIVVLSLVIASSAWWSGRHLKSTKNPVEDFHARHHASSTGSEAPIEPPATQLGSSPTQAQAMLLLRKAQIQAGLDMVSDDDSSNHPVIRASSAEVLRMSGEELSERLDKQSEQE